MGVVDYRMKGLSKRFVDVMFSITKLNYCRHKVISRSMCPPSWIGDLG